MSVPRKVAKKGAHPCALPREEQHSPFAVEYMLYHGLKPNIFLHLRMSAGMQRPGESILNLIKENWLLQIM